MSDYSQAPARQARPVHAYLLLISGCMSVLGATLIAPNLPRMQAHFAHVPHVEFLVPIALSIPALVIALLSLLVGALADRFGRKTLLIGGLLVFAAVGVAPIWLDSLYAIVATRAGVGLAEALIMTCCTALIGDYFEGAQRERYLALNTTFASISAVIFIAIGGALGEFGWRVPFALYAISLPLAGIMLLMLWEPRHGAAAPAPHGHAPAAVATGFSMRALLAICATTLAGGVFFMVVPVHIGYLLNGVGITSPATVGMIAAGNQGAVVAGSLLFAWLSRGSIGNVGRLALSSLLISTGYLIVGIAEGAAGFVIGTCVAGLGCGVLLPTLLCWTMGQLPAARRALGTGAWMAAFFLGQFFTPIVVVGLAGRVGSTQQAIWWMGAVLLPCAIALCFTRHRARSSAPLGSVVS